MGSNGFETVTERGAKALEGGASTLERGASTNDSGNRAEQNVTGPQVKEKGASTNRTENEASTGSSSGFEFEKETGINKDRTTVVSSPESPRAYNLRERSELGQKPNFNDQFDNPASSRFLQHKVFFLW